MTFHCDKCGSNLINNICRRCRGNPLIFNFGETVKATEICIKSGYFEENDVLVINETNSLGNGREPYVKFKNCPSCHRQGNRDGHCGGHFTGQMDKYGYNAGEPNFVVVALP